MSDASDPPIADPDTERRLLAALLDASSDVMWVVGADLRLLVANRLFRDRMFTDADRPMRIGDTITEVGFTDDEIGVWLDAYRRALDGETLTMRIDLPEGIFDARFTPLDDPTTPAAAALVTDVTASVAARRALEEREELLSMAAQLGRVAAWMVDATTREVVLSSELVELFDLDLDLASPLSLDEAVALFEPADRASIIDDIGRCLHDGTPIERQLHVLRPDGTEHWLRLLGAARSDETGRIEAVHGAIADITEQQTQIAMLDEQASLLDNASDSIIVQHLDGTVRYWNRSAERLYGWTSDEAVGRHIADLVDADERELFGEVSAALDRDGQWSGRVDNVDRHGRRITVDLHVNTLTGDDGRPRTVFSVARDVSAQIEIEQRLRQTQKLEALGQLAGGIAHDFNNLLTMIASSAELLGEIVGDDARTSSLIDTVLAATARGSDLTRRLLASARLQPLRPKVIDPVAAVDDGLQLVRRSLPETIDIVTRQPAERWTIEVDPAQLENAILNIALNARDAMEGRGRLTIAVEHVRAVDDATTNGAVRISISDSGHGMDDEVRLRVFDPFFTTKPIGAGSGLGLAMVHGFVQQSGGTIEIDSAPEVGTTVAMQFPRAESPIPDDRDSTAPGEIPRGDERLLVVEDDPLVRAQTVDSLRRLGYEVESVDHAGAALDRLERPDPRIDLVFSDVAMPGDLDGAELAEAISTRWPGLPVVLTSGHHDDQLASRIADRAFLAKPYRRGDLARAIREALDG